MFAELRKKQDFCFTEMKTFILVTTIMIF